MNKKAKEIWPPRNLVKGGVAELPVDSWDEFMSLIQHDHSDSPAFIYRGQTDADWPITSSLDRLEARFPTTENPHGSNPERFDCPPTTRNQHLEAFKESVRGKRGPHPQDLSEDEWWALAQHHGLATPLLDWAYSPFVALFFAFEEQGYIDWSTHTLKIPKRRAVYTASSHGILANDTKEHPGPELFSPRREITNRLSSQSGVLMKMPPGSNLEANVRARFTHQTYPDNPKACAVLTKITIPNEGRVDCLKLLNKMNINRMSLFPDLDGASRYINSLWELGFDTGLGVLPDGIDRRE